MPPKYNMKTFLTCSLLLPLAVLAQNAAPAQSAAPAQNPSAPVVKPGAPVTVPLRLTPTPQKPEVPPDTVVLVIGDKKFTRLEFEQLVQPQMRARLTEPERRRMAEQIADVVTLAAEARRQALDQTPYARENLDMLDSQWLARNLVDQEIMNKPLDEAVARAYYDAHPDEFEQVTARHILIRVKGSRVPVKPGAKDLTDAEALAKAQDLKKKLDAGADFATLARDDSDDTGSATNGGLLPPFSHGQMVPEFEKAAFAASIGKVTDPVKTQYGYHLILVTEHKEKPLIEARPQIEQKLKPEEARKYVDKIRSQTPVTIEESYFGKPAPPPPTLGPAAPAQSARPAVKPAAPPAPAPASAPAQAK